MTTTISSKVYFYGTSHPSNHVTSLQAVSSQHRTVWDWDANIHRDLLVALVYRASALQKVHIASLEPMADALRTRAESSPLWWRVMQRLRGLMMVPHMRRHPWYQTCRRAVARTLSRRAEVPIDTMRCVDVFHHRSVLPAWASKHQPSFARGGMIFYRVLTGQNHLHQQAPSQPSPSPPL